MMLKNNKILLFLTIFLLVFGLTGQAAQDYTYTQQSGTGFFVAAPDKADAQENENEIRQIVNDLGTLLGHTKMDGTYPKDLTTGGTLSAFDLYYLITQINTQAKMEAIWGVTLVNDGDLASYQPLDAALTNIAALTYVSPSFIKLTADDTYAVRTLTEVKTDLSLNLVENLKVKLDATEAPAAATDDITLGYAVGSRWVDITNDKEYVCLDNTDGAAVWTETTGAGGGASTFSALTDTPANYIGQAGKYVKVNAGEDALEYGTPAGAGDVSKVGTPVDNQVGVWTGDGTIEGAASFTYDGANLQLTGDIGSTGTKITKGWFTDLLVTNAIAGSVTGNAANLSGTPDLPDGTTATTQIASDNSTNLATTAYADAVSGGASTFLTLTDTPAAYDDGKYAKSTAAGIVFDTPAGAGNVANTGTPVIYDYARFTDATTIEGRSYTEMKTDLAYQLSDLSDVNTYQR